MAFAPDAPPAEQMCLPAWHEDVVRVRARSEQHGSLRARGCFVVDDPDPESGVEPGTVPCPPEEMRAAVQRRMQTLGLLPRDRRLSMETYAVARNIMSEVGRDATPEEQVAIAETAVNRWRKSRSRWPKLTDMLLRDGTRFARQSGRNPPVATSQDPTYENIVVAGMVLSGRTGNFTGGATHYFDPVAQDGLHREGRAVSAASVYESWTGDKLAWVGDLPGINPRRLFLFRDGRTLSRDAFEQATSTGFAALRYGAAVAELPMCRAVASAWGVGSTALVLGSVLSFAVGMIFSRRAVA